MVTLKKAHLILVLVAIIIAIVGSNFVKPIATAATQSLIISQTVTKVEKLEQSDKEIYNFIQNLSAQQFNTLTLLTEFEKRLNEWRQATDKRVEKLEDRRP